MVRTCCVRTCKEEWRMDKSLSFFAFPINNEELKEKWLQAGPGYKTVSKHSTVCSKHFLPEDYTDWTAYGGMRKLKKNAVPSIFNLACSTAIDNKGAHGQGKPGIPGNVRELNNGRRDQGIVREFLNWAGK